LELELGSGEWRVERKEKQRVETGVAA